MNYDAIEVRAESVFESCLDMYSKIYDFFNLRALQAFLMFYSIILEGLRVYTLELIFGIAAFYKFYDSGRCNILSLDFSKIKSI